MAPEYKIKITELAYDDICAIIEGIFEVSQSELSAEKWARKIIARIESLVTMPERFPVCEYDDEVRSTRVGKYKIFYQVKKQVQEVIILRVVYARRNLKEVILHKK